MNKRIRKKKQKHEMRCIEIWGYPQSYSELRKDERKYHENVIVQKYYRNITDFDDIEEWASIIGVSVSIEENKYNYPNRIRLKTYERFSQKTIDTILKNNK